VQKKLSKGIIKQIINHKKNFLDHYILT